MTLSINAAFDGGNIRLVSIEGDRIDLEIVPDRGSTFYQWFSFRLAGARGRSVCLRIVNAGGAAFPQGWRGYRVRASSDRVHWRMIETRYADGVLEFDWNGESELVWFAYFAPYPMERHDVLIAAATQQGATHTELGRSLDGVAIECLSMGTGGKPVWLIARQHPGEPMAEWWMEGAIEWLLAEAAAATLLAKATVHAVPNMNPDGSRRGHLRTNAAGINLNREWHAPTPERSPEVLCVRNAMDATGVAFAIDAHGDEAIPAVFFAGFDGIPSWREEAGVRFEAFRQRLAAHTPDFQIEKGYPKAPRGKANMTMATNQIAERYGAVAITLEMPFKDHDPNPDSVSGWSEDRSKALGIACMQVLAAMIDEL